MPSLKRPSLRLFLVLICLAAGGGVQARPAGGRPSDDSAIPLAFNVNNGKVVFFWPLQKGTAELQEKTAGTNDWKTVPENLYRTNGASVTATVPVADHEILYRIKRSPFTGKRPAGPGAPMMPALPPANTNHPPRPKPSTP